MVFLVFFFFQAEDGIRDVAVTGVQTCALPIFSQPMIVATASAAIATTTRRSFSNANRHDSLCLNVMASPRVPVPQSPFLQTEPPAPTQVGSLAARRTWRVCLAVVPWFCVPPFRMVCSEQRMARARRAFILVQGSEPTRRDRSGQRPTSAPCTMRPFGGSTSLARRQPRVSLEALRHRLSSALPLSRALVRALRSGRDK